MENWQELAKSAYLHELSQGGNIELMLQRSPVNTRENQELARFNAWLTERQSTWRGKWQNLYGDLPIRLQEHLLGLDAFARKQAIELAGVVAKAEAVHGPEGVAPRRGGLLGLLGIK